VGVVLTIHWFTFGSKKTVAGCGRAPLTKKVMLYGTAVRTSIKDPAVINAQTGRGGPFVGGSLRLESEWLPLPERDSDLDSDMLFVSCIDCDDESVVLWDNDADLVCKRLSEEESVFEWLCES